ncbi:DUF2891 domain-containing protein [Lichenibacterium dinghuense]|uniref:DUF2891 domain-containing protein n=1 Tax=Lichenibacterium dinghuense TaxID=2895977 RepID=UPI001F4432CA|nr:DUF2891 domain-containing protein [Lichenibacterium sp. 6Y81]
MRTILTEGRAAALARLVLGHVEREYPNKLDHAMDGPADVAGPSALHPVFFGSFDWHSCVHGYWTLARLLRRFPVAAAAGEIRALFDRRLTPGAVAGECAYLARPASRGFERPYGWAWLLKLAAELRGLDEGWSAALAPLADAVRDRFVGFLPGAAYPVRSGAHGNTAFALALARDYAVATADDELLGLLWEKAVDWYGRDRGCQAWEPAGDDFLSPALAEAECMRRLLPAGQWRPWFDAFLPELAEGRPATLFRPAAVSDRTDGKIAHLDGLNLSRAWCWRALASGLPAGDPRCAAMEGAAERHLDAALGEAVGDGVGHYMGEHWLASFALLALEA